MIPRIAVDDVEGVDLPEMMLQRVGCIDIRDTRIEAAAQQRGEPCFFKSLLISPLPMVFKLGHIARFVIGGVDVVHTCFKAGIHDGEILVWQRHIDDHLRLEALQQLHQFRDVVGIDTSSLDGPLEFSCDGIALRFCAGRQHDLAEHFRELGAFMNNHTTYAAGTNDKNSMRHAAECSRAWANASDRSDSEKICTSPCQLHDLGVAQRTGVQIELIHRTTQVPDGDALCTRPVIPVTQFRETDLEGMHAL